MLKYTPDTAEDFELVDPRVLRSATAAEREVMNRLYERNNDVRKAIKQTLYFRRDLASLPLTTDQYAARQYGNEARRQYRDVHPSERSPGFWNELRHGAARMAVREDRLAQTPLPKTTDPAHSAILETLKKHFSADDTTEMNVQTALQLASKYPEEISAAVASGTDAVERELRELTAKKEIVGLVEALGRLGAQNEEENYQTAQEELRKVSADLKSLYSGAGAGTARVLSGRNFGGLNAQAYQRFADALTNEERRLSRLVAAYRHMKGLLTRIRDGIAAASLPGAPAQFMRVVGNFDTELTREFDPAALASELRGALALQSEEQYAEQIRRKQEERKEIQDGKKVPSGPEAVISAYQKYFELKEDRSPTKAREIANELYARNAGGREQARAAVESAGRAFDEARPRVTLAGWPAQQLRELALGSQEAFVCNLAESGPIGVRTGLLVGGKYGGVFRGTRRFKVLWRKHAARPAWGSLARRHDGYGRLLTTYYSLREAVRQGHLSNTSYVRSQRNEIVRILIREHSRRLTEDFDLTDEFEEAERAEVGKRHQGKDFESSVYDALEGEIPPELADGVSAAIADADRRTARIRKAAYRATVWTAKNIVAKPAVATAKVGWKIASFPFKVLRGIWNWCWTKAEGGALKPFARRGGG